MSLGYVEQPQPIHQLLKRGRHRLLISRSRGMYFSTWRRRGPDGRRGKGAGAGAECLPRVAVVARGGARTSGTSPPSSHTDRDRVTLPQQPAGSRRARARSTFIRWSSSSVLPVSWSSSRDPPPSGSSSRVPWRSQLRGEDLRTPPIRYGGRPEIRRHLRWDSEIGGGRAECDSGVTQTVSPAESVTPV